MKLVKSLFIAAVIGLSIGFMAAEFGGFSYTRKAHADPQQVHHIPSIAYNPKFCLHQAGFTQHVAETLLAGERDLPFDLTLAERAGQRYGWDAGTTAIAKDLVKTLHEGALGLLTTTKVTPTGLKDLLTDTWALSFIADCEAGVSPDEMPLRQGHTWSPYFAPDELPGGKTGT